MKKLIVCLLTLSMLLCLAACGDSADAGKTTDPAGETAEAATELAFWYSQQDWENMGSGTYDGTVIGGQLQLPATPESLDALFAPYTVGYGDEETQVASLQSLADSQDVVNQYGIHIPRDHRYKYTTSGIFLTVTDVTEDNPITYSECFRSGYLGIDFEPSAFVEEQSADWDDIEEAKQLVVLLGKPTHVYPSGTYETAGEEFQKNLAKGTGSLNYIMVYEFEGYTLAFTVSEVVSDYYNVASLDILSCNYYSPALWALREAQFPHSPIF